MRGHAATFPAIFSVVNAVLLRPLAYPNADELVSLKFTAPGAPELGEFNMSSTLYLTYLDEARTFENLGLWVNGGYTVTGIGNPEQARTVNATHGVLPALGVQPLLGRAFAAADDSRAADGALPVILSYARAGPGALRQMARERRRRDIWLISREFPVAEIAPWRVPCPRNTP
jgi:hypothetical protein